jgi:radical SAM protein with 4Fe4S-binding SPASM domain
MEGLELLAHHGLPVRLKTVVITINFHELMEMKAIAERFGWEFRYDAMITPRLNGDRSPTLLRLSPEQLVEVEQLDVRRSEEWQEHCATFLGNKVKGGDHTFTCGAAYNSAHVDAYGMVSPCMITRSRAIDWRDTDFDTVWNGYLAAVRKTRNEEATACHSCAMSLVCSNCPGWSTLERNTLENRPVDWLCESTKARVNAFAPDAERWLTDSVCLEPSR